VGFPSKSLALVLGDAAARGGVEPVLIFRSDSNLEDQAGRARPGSAPLPPCAAHQWRRAGLLVWAPGGAGARGAAGLPARVMRVVSGRYKAQDLLHSRPLDLLQTLARGQVCGRGAV